MKRKITLLLLAAASVVTMNAQVTLSEDFTSPFNPSTNDWVIINNSVPQGTVSWTQGNQTGGNGTLTAYNGSTDDFYMADFLSVPLGQSGGISAFLITPTVNIYNGAVLQFATTTFSNSTIFPDRLQVLMSQTGNTVIPSGVTQVGSFGATLLDINPNLTTSTSSVVSNGVVNGYPQAWTVYSVQVSGVTGTVTGRFAFRYFVTNGGSTGANSRLVAIDAVKYSLPCGPTVQSYTVCSGASTTLTAIGGLSSTTYSWSTSSTNSNIVVAPVATTIYTLYPSSGTVSCGNSVTATVSIGSQLSMNVSASASTICSGDVTTLTAVSAAGSYSWTIGLTPIGSGAVITVTPNTTTTYSVGGVNGSSCYGFSGITINVNPSPTITAAATPSMACVGGSVTISGSGAATYTILGGNTNPLTIPTGTDTGGFFTFVEGSAANGCSDLALVQFTVNDNPTVTAVSSITGTVCTNTTITLTGSGADTFTWSGAATSTDNPLSFPTGSVAGVKHFTVTGTDATTGCKAKAVVNQNVVVCNTNTNTAGIGTINGYEETSIFPNPFTNEIKINVLDGNVVIFNALGQAVINVTVHSSETINTAELAKGVYLVKAYNANGELVKSTKLIKN